MNHFQLQIHRLLNWEYWPMQAIYYPLFPAWAYFALRARSLFFFNAANPSIAYGGMAMESKKDIYDLIPEEYIPKTVLIGPQESPSAIKDKMQSAGLNYPVIAKPDIGLKALGVEALKSEEDLQSYLKKNQYNFLLQELVSHPKEIGIFYVRHPNESRGQITGMVHKEFLSVTGDGEQKLLDLIKAEPRSHLQLGSLRKEFGDRLQEVPAKGEEVVLVPYGSHTRGAKFIDVTDKQNPDLIKTIDEICQQIPGFYFGRLDILYENIEELSKGQNFKIIEVNGAGSEPTHIYDPKHSYFFALSEIVRHWNWLYEISAANRKNGHEYLSFKDGRKMVKDSSRLEAQLKTM